MNTQAALQKAIDQFGGQKPLGEAIGSSQSEVSQWVTGHRPIPAHKAVAIEKATKGDVKRQWLRPQDWKQLWPELAA